MTRFITAQFSILFCGPAAMYACHEERGMHIAKIGARMIVALGTPLSTDKANYCWDCERMGVWRLDDGSMSRLVSERCIHLQKAFQ